jgi:hypothetical protein
MWQIFLAWFQAHEFVAIWLEGIALVLIFGLDWRERIDQRKERREQHQETAAQLAASQSQLDAMKKSADAATEAALAANKSAEIAAALHRPFMGLSNVTLPGGRTTRLWNVVFALRNYGTLPASRVGLAVEFFIDNTPRWQTTEQVSVQIFPSDEFSWTVQFDLGDIDLAPVSNGTKTLRIKARIPYQAQDGRVVEYTAEVSYRQGLFRIDKSETH